MPDAAALPKPGPKKLDLPASGPADPERLPDTIYDRGRRRAWLGR